ncbi:MAG: SDR family NAD(P)-dependent oxidoreductase [Burkholderiaceae bacterium]
MKEFIKGSAALAPVACLYFGWSRITSVHFRSGLDGSAAALPHMKQKKSGYLIKVSSLNGQEAGLRFAIYAQARNVLRAMSKGLCLEANPCNTPCGRPALPRLPLRQCMRRAT